MPHRRPLLDSGRTRRRARPSGRIHPPRNPAGVLAPSAVPVWNATGTALRMCIPPRESAVCGTALPCRTSIFRLSFRPALCRMISHHPPCIDTMRKERSVDSKSKATKASSGRGSGRLRSVLPRRCAQVDRHLQDVFVPGTSDYDCGGPIRGLHNAGMEIGGGAISFMMLDSSEVAKL